MSLHIFSASCSQALPYFILKETDLATTSVRGMGLLQGMGLHKCQAGISFVDEVKILLVIILNPISFYYPRQCRRYLTFVSLHILQVLNLMLLHQLFKAIFRLKNLRRKHDQLALPASSHVRHAMLLFVSSDAESCAIYRRMSKAGRASWRLPLIRLYYRSVVHLTIVSRTLMTSYSMMGARTTLWFSIILISFRSPTDTRHPRKWKELPPLIPRLKQLKAFADMVLIALVAIFILCAILCSIFPNSVVFSSG